MTPTTFVNHPTLWLVIAGSVALSALLLLAGWRQAATPEAKSAWFSTCGASLSIGAFLAVVSLMLQQAFAEDGADAVWRAGIATSSEISGLSVADHELHEPQQINFSGKVLHNAELESADLHDLSFRDAQLAGSDFTDADLSGADLVGADLTSTVFKNADLEGADLRVAHFVRAELSTVKSMQGAKVNANTCWPAGFLTSANKTFVRLRSQLTATSTTDGATHRKATSLRYEESPARPCRPFDR